jgi:hypothetical protein
MYGSGRASQEVFIDLSAWGLASMYPASIYLHKKQAVVGNGLPGQARQ